MYTINNNDPRATALDIFRGEKWHNGSAFVDLFPPQTLYVDIL